MKNLTTSANIGSEIAAVLLFQFSTLVITKKLITPVYYVDDCQIDGDIINVDFTLNDAWAETTISLPDLKRFIVTTGLNDYCFDYSANGEHVQDSGSMELDAFIAENLSYVVGAYLQSKKICQNVN